MAQEPKLSKDKRDLLKQALDALDASVSRKAADAANPENIRKLWKQQKDDIESLKREIESI